MASLPRQFHFVQFWLRDHSFYGVVESAWNVPIRGDPRFWVFQKLRATKKALQIWNKNFFGHIQSSINQLKEEISSRLVLPPTADNIAIVKSLNVALDEQLQREEIFWKQKSRVEWLVSSDLNTRYFHASTVTKRCRNHIVWLQNSEGRWITSRTMLGNYLVEFYQALYSSSAPVSPEDFDGLIQPCISEEENASLCATPSSSKFFAALRKMNPYRAPGPNDMTPLFFTSCWGSVGADIVSMIQSFYRVFFSHWNATTSP